VEWREREATMSTRIYQEDERLLGTGLTRQVLRGAIAVHRELGPGLLESAYRTCLLRELDLLGLAAKQEVEIPIDYRGTKLHCGYRADIIVEDRVLLELKTVEKLLPIHEAQLFTYLKLAGLRVGFL
jgi:GxxExxY protein